MLNNKEMETLLILQEECAEVTQAISKIFRFGWEDHHPVTGISNTDKLHEELGDLLCMISLLYDLNLIDSEKIERAIDAKKKKLKVYSKIYGEAA